MKWCRFKYQNEINHGIIENNMIINKFIENDREYHVSSAEYILEQIQ